MDLSHLVAFRFKTGNKTTTMIFLKKKGDKKGFLLTRVNGIITDLETLYPTDASKRFERKETELVKQNNKTWHYLDGDEYRHLKNLISWSDSFHDFGSLQQDSIPNRIRQRI